MSFSWLKMTGLDGSELGVGIGIDSGEASFGEFGRSHRDLTAIGTVVNTAARAQSAAEAGQILVTRAVYDRARRQTAEREGRNYHLKGFEKPVELYADLSIADADSRCRESARVDRFVDTVSRLLHGHFLERGFERPQSR